MEYITFQRYTTCNILKVVLREHYCHKCGNRLTIIEHEKIVDSKSEEAKYYEPYVEGSGIGPYKFVHNVFFCNKCYETIEYITQISIENVNIIIYKVKSYFKKRGNLLKITKTYEYKNGSTTDKYDYINKIFSICLNVEYNKKIVCVYKVPSMILERYNRPHYYKLSKKDLIKYIKDKLSDNITD